MFRKSNFHYGWNKTGGWNKRTWDEYLETILELKGNFLLTLEISNEVTLGIDVDGVMGTRIYKNHFE